MSCNCTKFRLNIVLLSLALLLLMLDAADGGGGDVLFVKLCAEWWHILFLFPSFFALLFQLFIWLVLFDCVSRSLFLLFSRYSLASSALADKSSMHLPMMCHIKLYHIFFRFRLFLLFVFCSSIISRWQGKRLKMGMKKVPFSYPRPINWWLRHKHRRQCLLYRKLLALIEPSPCHYFVPLFFRTCMRRFTSK